MLHALAKNWWVLLLRGICAIFIGMLACGWPLLTLVVLVYLYGAFLLLDGITAIMLGLNSRTQQESWWAMVLLGILGVIAAIVAVSWPEITLALFAAIIAATAIVRGILEITAAIRLRKVIEGEWLLGLAGASSILFGILVLAWPGAALVTVAWIIGVTIIAIGIFCVALSFRLRSLGQRLDQASNPSGSVSAAG
jgi:uncharacterized membrane protein HdeD (DUF308 family)